MLVESTVCRRTRGCRCSNDLDDYLPNILGKSIVRRNGRRRFSLQIQFGFAEIRTPIVLPQIPHLFSFENILANSDKVKNSSSVCVSDLPEYNLWTYRHWRRSVSVTGREMIPRSNIRDSVEGNYFIDLMGGLLHPVRLVIMKNVLCLFEFDGEGQILENNQKLNEYVLSKCHIVQLKFQ